MFFKQLHKLLKEAGSSAVVVGDRCVVVIAGGSEAVAAEVHRCDFASSGSSSCGVVA